MSILREYEMVRKEMGASKWNALQIYLSYNKYLYLSDVIYKQEEWAKFELWLKNANLDTMNPKSNVIESEGATYYRVCSRCGTRVEPTPVEDYDWYCPNHDEDLFNFETELIKGE